MLTGAQRYAPPVPPALPEDPPWHRSLRAFRTNVIPIWPARAYQDELSIGRFLGRQWFLVNAPDVIRHVLIDHPANFRRTRATIRILQPIVGRGLLLSDGEDWKHQRRTLAPAFAPRTIPLLAHHVAQVAAETVNRLAAAADQPVDLLAAMQQATLEIAGRSMFSLGMAHHGPALRAQLARYTEQLGRPYMLDLLLPVGIPTWHDLRRRVFRQSWMRLLDRLIAARAAMASSADADPDAPRDLFDLLASARDPETGAGFDPAQLRDQIATLLIAGHETTALALFWSLYLLAGAPAEQARLAAEAEGLDLGPAGAADALPKLVYTRAVVSEALRLYPPAFVIVRRAIGAERIGPLALPAGATIMISPWVLHRHRRHWREPDAFDPTRFLPDAPPVDRFAYLPFGVGPRVCIGAQFALTEATLVLAALVQRFRIEVDPGHPVLPLAVVATRPDHAPAFRLTPRRAA